MDKRSALEKAVDLAVKAVASGMFADKENIPDSAKEIACFIKVLAQHLDMQQTWSRDTSLALADKAIEGGMFTRYQTGKKAADDVAKFIIALALNLAGESTPKNLGERIERGEFTF